MEEEKIDLWTIQKYYLLQSNAVYIQIGEQNLAEKFCTPVLTGVQNRHIAGTGSFNYF